MTTPFDAKSYDAAYRAANRETLRAKQLARKAANPEAERARRKRYRYKHAEKLKGYEAARCKVAQRKRDSARWARNAVAIKAKHREWCEANGHKLSEYNARRRTTALGDCAPVYEIARRVSACTGIPHEVDHILPVKGKTVSGLHVPINLQWVPKMLNRRKSNTVTP